MACNNRVSVEFLRRFARPDSSSTFVRRGKLGLDHIPEPDVSVHVHRWNAACGSSVDVHLSGRQHFCGYRNGWARAYDCGKDSELFEVHGRISVPGNRH